MLHFFRKYQKIFFILTTIIIVMSFVFYGAFQSFSPGFRSKGEAEESYVGQMTRFLNTEQWMISRKLFAANFLNDGVITKEFLETGMADLVMAAWPERFQQDFESRAEREQNYHPYIHPYIPSLSATTMWSIFAPEIPQKLAAFQASNGGFKERTALFLAQKSFPPAFLSQIIRYQEQNNPKAPTDSRLSKDDIALFSYSDLSDWFGDSFVETVAQLIIDTADVARKRGFKVSKEEVLSELVLRSHEVYQGLKQKISLPVEDGFGLFQLYLRQTGFQEQTALKIWEDVTLFRRMMHAVGDAALVDPLPLSQFYAYAYENALVEVAQMSPEFKLSSMDDLKRLEVYLAAVEGKRRSALDIPSEYAALSAIEGRAPELVGKRYRVYYVETSKNALQAKVSVKETLQWECMPENWTLLQRQFPELAQKTGEAFDVLENLDEKLRKLVDTFARKQIVEQHPEWIHEVLIAKDMNEKELFLGSKSEKPFDGITDTGKFSAALDEGIELMGYTQDGNHFYRFLVMEHGEEKEILTYQAALKGGVLDKLLKKMPGDALVQPIIAATPAQYKDTPYAYRFAQFVQKAIATPPEGKLAQQFSVEKREKTITRSERSFISLDEALSLGEENWSPLKVDPKEGAYLYRFIEKRADKSLPLEKMVKSQELLSKEARCRYFETLLKNA